MLTTIEITNLKKRKAEYEQKRLEVGQDVRNYKKDLCDYKDAYNKLFNSFGTVTVEGVDYTSAFSFEEKDPKQYVICLQKYADTIPLEKDSHYITYFNLHNLLGETIFRINQQLEENLLNS